MNSETLDRVARKRAGAKLGFYIHAAVSLFLAAGNAAAQLTAAEAGLDP
jgi:hypothetical protein